jgi:alkylation response protein AidB-like acyl-CoA dehydrogenase
MKLTFSKEDEHFRAEIASWLKANLVGEFEQLKFRGGPGDEHMFSHERKVWEQKLAEGGWTCVGWPKEHGGRGASIEQQVVFLKNMRALAAPGAWGISAKG